MKLIFFDLILSERRFQLHNHRIATKTVTKSKNGAWFISSLKSNCKHFFWVVENTLKIIVSYTYTNKLKSTANRVASVQPYGFSGTCSIHETCGWAASELHPARPEHSQSVRFLPWGPLTFLDELNRLSFAPGDEISVRKDMVYRRSCDSASSWEESRFIGLSLSCFVSLQNYFSLFLWDIECFLQNLENCLGAVLDFMLLQKKLKYCL